MGDEPFKTWHETSTKESSGSSTRSTPPHQVAFAMERARMLFGSYRRGDANDPEVYVAAITAVLTRYPPDLVREVTDPNTGIQTSEKYLSFMPNAGELKAYCDGVAARKQHLRWLGKPAPQPAALLDPPPRPPGDLAQVFVPQDHKRYQSLVDWSTGADSRLWRFGKASDGRLGIWVAYSVWEYRQMTPARDLTSTEPGPLVLTEAARKVMRDIDAERNRTLPVDQEFPE